MKFTSLILLIFSVQLYCQPKLEVTINSVVSNDSISGNRQYIIEYQIENLTAEKLSFFLKPSTLICSNSGSLQNYPMYKIYENEEYIPVEINNEEMYFQKYQKKKDSILTKLISQKTELLLSDFPKYKSVMKDLFELNPNETKTFTNHLNWDKKRYHLIGDLQYYINENSKYYFEITLILLKSEFKNKLTKLEYSTIMENKNFLNSVIVSNKVAIDFSN